MLGDGPEAWVVALDSVRSSARRVQRLSHSAFGGGIRAPSSRCPATNLDREPLPRPSVAQAFHSSAADDRPHADDRITDSVVCLQVAINPSTAGGPGVLASCCVVADVVEYPSSTFGPTSPDASSSVHLGPPPSPLAVQGLAAEAMCSGRGDVENRRRGWRTHRRRPPDPLGSIPQHCLTRMVYFPRPRREGHPTGRERLRCRDFRVCHETVRSWQFPIGPVFGWADSPIGRSSREPSFNSRQPSRVRDIKPHRGNFLSLPGRGETLPSGGVGVTAH